MHSGRAYEELGERELIKYLPATGPQKSMLTYPVACQLTAPRFSSAKDDQEDDPCELIYKQKRII